MMSFGEMTALIGASAGMGAAAAGIVVKVLNRNVDDAAAEQSLANARKSDVDNLRAIIAEVRESEARKAQQIDALEVRLAKLEERERHSLTRAAVHEAWDALLLSHLTQSGADMTFPPPPPLTWRESDDPQSDF